jgi:Asp-tRNA(Asn)/Glu-tRNA(Gln) amidotransferase A subunit family amidase
MSTPDIRTRTSTADDVMPAFASATDLGEATRGKRLSSRELLNLTFQRVDAHNPTIRDRVAVPRAGSEARGASRRRTGERDIAMVRAESSS